MQNRRSFVESCCKVNAQPRPLPSSLNNRPLNHVKLSLTQGSYIDEHTGDHMEKRLNSFIFQPFIYIWFISNLRFDGGRSAKLKSCIDVSRI